MEGKASFFVASESRRVATARPGGGLRILVADDHVDTAQSIETLLAAFGHEVRTAFDGLEALEQAEALRPDLVVLDVEMPRMNGWECCRRMRETPWGGRVYALALTARGEPGDQEESLRAGFDGHLIKPLDLPVLLQAIERARSRVEGDRSEGPGTLPPEPILPSDRRD